MIMMESNMESEARAPRDQYQGQHQSQHQTQPQLMQVTDPNARLSRFIDIMLSRPVQLDRSSFPSTYSNDAGQMFFGFIAETDLSPDEKY